MDYLVHFEDLNDKVIDINLFFLVFIEKVQR